MIEQQRSEHEQTHADVEGLVGKGEKRALRTGLSTHVIERAERVGDGGHDPDGAEGADQATDRGLEPAPYADALVGAVPSGSEPRCEAFADQPRDDQHHRLNAEGHEQRCDRLTSEILHAVPRPPASGEREQGGSGAEDRELPVGRECGDDHRSDARGDTGFAGSLG